MKYLEFIFGGFLKKAYFRMGFFVRESAYQPYKMEKVLLGLTFSVMRFGPSTP